MPPQVLVDADTNRMTGSGSVGRTLAIGIVLFVFAAVAAAADVAVVVAERRRVSG